MEQAISLAHIEVFLGSAPIVFGKKGSQGYLETLAREKIFIGRDYVLEE